VKLVRVGAAVLNTTPLDWEGNRRAILAAIAEARRQRVSVLCLPELCISGYGCEDMFHSRALHRTALDLLLEITAHTEGIVVSLGLPFAFRNGVFNVAALACDGRLEGLVAKQFLPGDGIHYEPRWFKAWPADQVAHVEIDGRTIPLGDVYFDCDGVAIGFEICEDAWVSVRPGSDLARRAVDVILNPSASHFAFSKVAVRERLVTEGSRAFGVTYVYANLVGNEAGRAIYEGGALIASGGVLIAAGPRFTFQDFAITSAVVDVDTTRMARSQLSSFLPDVRDDVEDRVRCDFLLPDIEPESPVVRRQRWEHSPAGKPEEFTRALSLALFDYLRKAHARGFAVSLSGGADSSAMACLVRLMVDLGVAELGADGFLDKLGRPPRCAGATDAASITRGLLTCVYQATEHSSETTRHAARAVAEAIGGDFYELDVDPLFKSYVAMVGAALARDITWEESDLALQNIQARVRSPGIWMITNLRGALLLATSNRSEAAVGYATMDGDTCGGLSPLAGIDKAFLREWLAWLETEGPEGRGPIPELVLVNAQAPTAELRPADRGQTDEGDLMPYPVLDAIERLAIRDKMSPLETYRKLRAAFPEYDVAAVLAWVERFFALWCRNQWKRERYAPSFHLDDENLDPKTWCRFPILSGGYERELAELRTAVERDR
jgi:NAD+ synthase (glutamine-hydrolysing)